MAGNIVKWWKHKILGGYKQFSVLQECTTDSEELIHPVRAPSSCSAPPDLLLVGSERDNNVQVVKSPMNGNSHNNHHQQQHQQQQQQQQQQSHHHQQTSHKTSSHQKENHVKHQLQQQQTNLKNPEIEGPSEKLQNDGRIHLEEFTCDVSVEGGKSSQPLQFSFTFYDLDGHHGKITKDDIVGIVYTIYESIGKSVVVPHCGSKTINVRLTVSPEGKSKSNGKLKKTNLTSGGGGGGGGHQHQQQQSHNIRRQHRYRPRKLIKSDDEDEDGESGSDKDITKLPTTSKQNRSIAIEASVNNSHHHQKYYNCPEIRPIRSIHHNNTESTRIPQTEDSPISSGHQTTSSQQHQQQESNNTNCKYPIADNIYESMANLKCCSKESRKVELGGCKDCVQSSIKAVATAAVVQQPSHQDQQQQQQQQYLKQISARAKLLRKARKQKYQEQCFETRQRSLSVGNESCWKVRTDKTNRDDIDGRSRTVPTTAECWNNALKRNDLIDIIRESMEKNRLCFQSNGKPQSNISPIHHRQRSNTVISRMATDENYSPPPQSSHHIPIYHQQMAINPAILAAQQQINAHMKTNLCGYDSFLHATICSTVATANNTIATASQQTPITVPNQSSSMAATATATATAALLAINNHQSPKTHQSNPVNSNNLLKASKIPRNGYHSQQNSPQFQGYQRLTSGHHGHTKLNTTLLNSLNPHLSAEEKLNRTIDHVEKWLVERDQASLDANEIKKSGVLDEGKSKKDVKNYDNLLYAKLSEKLQQQQQRQQQQEQNSRKNANTGHNNNITAASNSKNNNNDKENIRRLHQAYNNSNSSNYHHHHHQKMHRRNVCMANNILTSNSVTQQQGCDKNNIDNSHNKFVTLIPINVVDPSECENLIHPSDEDSTIPPASPNSGRSGRSGRGNHNNGEGDGIDGRNSNTSNSNNGNNSNTSSTVHRYVHEHIHHHYHHFENKEN